MRKQSLYLMKSKQSWINLHDGFGLLNANTFVFVERITNDFMLSFITNPRKAFHFSRGERKKSSPHLTPRHLSFSRPRLHFLPPRHPFRLRLRSFLHAAAVRRSKLGSPSVSPSLPLCGCICGDPNNKTSTCINLTGRNLTGLTLCATAVHFHVEKMEKSTEGKR